MSDTIELPGGEWVPIQDTICECGHWYDEHVGDRCCGCDAGGHVGAKHFFVADPEGSTAEAIADRGGDPDCWPEHVRRHAQEWAGLELARVGISGDDTIEASGLD